VRVYKVRVLTDVLIHFADDATADDALHVVEHCTTARCSVADSGIGTMGKWRAEEIQRIIDKVKEVPDEKGDKKHT
jgi:hypothetical protein